MDSSEMLWYVIPDLHHVYRHDIRKCAKKLLCTTCWWRIVVQYRSNWNQVL